MKRAFLIGCVVSIVLLISGVISGNYVLYGNILLSIGIISIIISALVSGAFLNGSELRANFHTETKEDRKERIKTMSVTGLFAIPPLVAAALLLLL